MKSIILLYRLRYNLIKNTNNQITNKTQNFTPTPQTTQHHHQKRKIHKNTFDIFLANL
ncbi:MAG: hypothetical protein LBH59_04625 [Planctomycetaceae bacterium]|nr:hypothetical protein [Planctomycetaceae bacterium]